MADLIEALVAAAQEGAPYNGTARNPAYTPNERLSCAVKALDLYDVVAEQAEEEAEARQSGDRRLPPPYDKLSANDRGTWLVLEGLYDGSLTPDVRRANVGRPMTPWAELHPEAQQALSATLLQVVQVIHAVSLNPLARYDSEEVPTDG